MQYDLIIVGQGITGTFLGWYLGRAGFSVIVIDAPDPNSASRVASGVINPVTGRRIVKSWMIDTLMPFALEAYSNIGQELGIQAIRQKSLLDFFPSPQMRQAFEERIAENADFLQWPDSSHEPIDFFRHELGFGIVSPVYLVDLAALLPAYRRSLKSKEQLWEDQFNIDELVVSARGISYRNIEAARIIFCDGVASTRNPWFKNLPFAPNKGEAFWVEIKDLPDSYILKKGFSLVPWDKDIFWLGSTYQWSFEDANPGRAFRGAATQWLNTNLTCSWRLLDHRASIRPATLERRPFIGFHPQQPQIGICNGMGTKGCSLGPFMANQLANFIKDGRPISAEASVERYRSLLSKTF